MYKVVVLKSAEKELMKLPVKVQLKIIAAIDELVENPRPFGYKKLVGRDGFRIKIGNYRVIYEIEDEQLSIFVLEIGNRKDIYRK